MSITGLAYLHVGATDLDEWARYASQLAGMQVGERASSRLSLRMDERRERLVVYPATQASVQVFGWEVANASDLDTLASRLEGHGVAVRRGTASERSERGVSDFIAFRDPLGNRLEAGFGFELARSVFEPGRPISGFRTGALGLGHVVCAVESIDPALAFYRDVLGFGLSDYYDHPFRGYFFHVNQRHHSFALIESGRIGVHHLMIEHFDLDDVGQGYDIAGQEEGRVAVTLGRHCGDYMTSYYSRTPSQFLIEHGWGGRLIDPATWSPELRKEGPSLWGHDRSWLPADARARALDLRMKNAASGLRRPVQVIAGNHVIMPGEAPVRGHVEP